MSDLEAFAEDGSVFADAADLVAREELEYAANGRDSDLDPEADLASEMPPLMEEWPTKLTDDDFPALGGSMADNSSEEPQQQAEEVEAAAEEKPVEVQEEVAEIEAEAVVEEAPEAQPQGNGVEEAEEVQQEEQPVAQVEEAEEVQQEEQPVAQVEEAEEVQQEEQPVAQIEEAEEVQQEEEPVAQVEEAQEVEDVAQPQEVEVVSEPIAVEELEAVVDSQADQAEVQQQVETPKMEQQAAAVAEKDADGLVEDSDEDADGLVAQEAAFEDLDPEDMDDGIELLNLEADPIPEGPIDWTPVDRKYRRARMFQSLQSNGVGAIFFGGLEVDAPQPKPDTSVSTSTSTTAVEADDEAGKPAPATQEDGGDADADPKTTETTAEDEEPAPATEQIPPEKIPMLKAFVNQAVELLTEGASEGHYMSQVRLWQHQFRQIGGRLGIMDLSQLEACCNHDLESFRANSKLPFRPNYFQTVHMALARALSVHQEKQNFYLAAHHFRQSARLGDPVASQRLGYVEYRIAQQLMADDFKEGYRYLKLAAKHKFPDALHHLMNIHLRGHPPLVEKNPERALRYATSGAALGNGACLYILGEHHDKAGRKPDAAQCMLKAAQAGVQAAFQYLQVMAMNGSQHAGRAMMEFQQWSQQQQAAVEQQLRLQRIQTMMRERQQNPAEAAAEKKSTPCARCERPNSTHRCGKCKKAKYCSEECQQRHWKAHRTQCKKWSGQA